MEPRNKYLTLKVADEEKAIEKMIAEIPLEIALKTALDQLKSEGKNEAKKNKDKKSRLKEYSKQYPEVRVGDIIYLPLLDSEPAFKRPPTYFAKENHTGVLLCGSATEKNIGCGESRQTQRKPGQESLIYCTCLAAEENRIRRIERKNVEEELKKNIADENARYGLTIQQLSDNHRRQVQQLEEKSSEDIQKKIKYNAAKTKMSSLANVLKNKIFSPKDILMDNIITLPPPPENPDQPGLSEEKVDDAIPQTRIIINTLLQQAHRLHWKNSCCFFSKGTDKAVRIITALASLLANIEAQEGNTDQFIAEKLIEACTQPMLKSFKEENGFHSFHQNPLYDALHEKRNFFGFFPSTSAIAIEHLKPQTLPERLIARFPCPITLNKK